MNGTPRPATGESRQEDVAVTWTRLSGSRAELVRLKRLRRRQQRIIRRNSAVLPVITPYLRLRETIPEIFWRVFVVLIGSSCLTAIAVVLTFNITTALTTAGVGVGMFTVLLLCPPDSVLLRRQRICAQVKASAHNEHQNISGQLDVARRRYETIRDRFQQVRQTPPASATPGAKSTESAP